ncbi:hypothetical protein SLS54_009840 [Diplodia seriata]
MAQLKKKTHGKGRSEEERWRKVFTTVFPEVDEISIPSPYCEAGIQFSHLAQLEDYLRIRTIPETERMLSANFKQFPAELTRQLPRMVLSVFEKLSTEYRLGERETVRRTSQSSQAEREDHDPSEDSSEETYEPFASLDFTELENFEADQINFGYDEYLGLLGEISTPKPHRDFQE